MRVETEEYNGGWRPFPQYPTGAGLSFQGAGGAQRYKLVNPHSGWTAIFDTFREANGTFTVSINSLAQWRPTPVVTYYVDKNRPDNTGDGLSWATAFADVRAAVVKLDVDRITIRERDGRYMGTQGWANAIGIRGIQVETEAGLPVYLINTATRTYPTWAAYSGTTYSTPQASNNYIFGDFGILDVRGRPTRPVRATSLSNCTATLGTFWNESGQYYLNTGNGRNLIGDVNVVLLAPTNNIRWAPANDNLTLSLKNVYPMGGKTVWNDPSASGTATANVLFEDCQFLLAHTGSAANGTNIAVGGLVMALRCHAVYCEADGFNWHGSVAGVPLTPSATVYEINCFADARNGYIGSTASSNNSTTAHESTMIQRVNNTYRYAEGRTQADIDNVKAWSLGCTFGASLSNGSSCQSVQVASTNAHYMDSCTIEHGLGAVDVSVNNANGLQIANMNLAGVTVDAPQNVVTYVPQQIAV